MTIHLQNHISQSWHVFYIDTEHKKDLIHDDGPYFTTGQLQIKFHVNIYILKYNNIIAALKTKSLSM